MRAVPVALAVAFVALSAACGGGSSPTGTPNVSQTIASAATTTQAPAKAATPLQETASVAATAPGAVPTAPPVSTEGTPAVEPSDQAAFLAQFQGQDVGSQSCTYNPGTAIADCVGVLYAVDPPMVAQGIDCVLWVVGETPRALACTSAEPMQSTYYEIQ